VVRLGGRDRVSIIGSLEHEEYLREMTEARLNVSCSTVEAFGLPVAEGLAMGAPVVCSDIPAHRELVERAGAGEIFPVGDDEALAEAFCRALRGRLPTQVAYAPAGWDWRARAREHIDAYERFL
jgi:phosphatidylinositol alpha-mannosyltransferase